MTSNIWSEQLALGCNIYSYGETVLDYESVPFFSGAGLVFLPGSATLPQ